MKPPARAIVGNLVWGTDGGVWATWRVDPLPLSYQPRQDQLAAHARLRGLLVGLPEESMLLSVCERLDPWDVVADMVQDIDLDARPAWTQVAGAATDRAARAASSIRWAGTVVGPVPHRPANARRRSPIEVGTSVPTRAHT